MEKLNVGIISVLVVLMAFFIGTTIAVGYKGYELYRENIVYKSVAISQFNELQCLKYGICD